MPKFKSKIFTYSGYLINLIVVCIKEFIFIAFRRPSLYRFCFDFCTTMNELYRRSHGKLKNFEETQTFAKLKNDMIFAQCNYFNTDIQVARPKETQVICELVQVLKPKNIFEIGTYSGFTTIHFAANTSANAKVYTLDLSLDFKQNVNNKERISKYSFDDLKVVELSAQNFNKRMYKGRVESDKIVELFGNSRDFDFSPYFGKIDLVFIDGNHSYDYVKSDTENAFKLLSDKGVIIWHDYDYIFHKDIFCYLNDLVKEHAIYSIAQTRFAIYGKYL
ncbi:MAG: class I SAM-dependent methyltransferase [Candidatus Omnitrophica bacterium]|nr:class I SAM-dependent methyltransferase [Candidatus Omnitrophota bacterium]